MHNLFKKITVLILAICLFFSFSLSIDTQTVLADSNSSAKSTTEKSNNTVYVISNGHSTIIDKDNLYSKKGYSYIKYQATADGYIALKFTNASSSQSSAEGNVWLCNSNNQEISSRSLYNVSAKKSFYKTIYYGVTKNTTYYFKIKTVSNSPVKISLKLHKVKTSTNTKLAKAATLKAGKYKSGSIAAGSTSVRYYKINLTSAQKIKLTYYGLTNSKLTFKIYKVGSEYFSRNSIITYFTDKHSTTITSKKLVAGTYYIEVSAYDSKSSGYYKLMWKKAK